MQSGWDGDSSYAEVKPSIVRYLSLFVRCLVNIVDWDRAYEFLQFDALLLCKFEVDEGASCACIDEGVGYNVSFSEYGCMAMNRMSEVIS